MSRRGFRVAVQDPRPTSAWLLVGVATATLGITGQLAPWALAAAAAAHGVSLWRRSDPFLWQTNLWVLNAMMIAIGVSSSWDTAETSAERISSTAWRRPTSSTISTQPTTLPAAS